MKSKFIKSLMNSFNSRERERERSLGCFFMKKESNGIGENKNSKKISKNNKIISSILAVAMCCQSFVVAVKPDEFVGNNDGIVEETKGKEDVDGNTGEDREDNEDKSGSIIDKIKNLSDFVKYGLGLISGVLIGRIGVRASCNKDVFEKDFFNKYVLGLKFLGVKLGSINFFIPTFNIGEKIGEKKENEFTNTCFLHAYKFSKYDIGIRDLVCDSIKFYGDEKEVILGANTRYYIFDSDFFERVFEMETVKSEAEKLSQYSQSICKLIMKGKQINSEDTDLKGALKYLNECESSFRVAILSFEVELIDVDSNLIPHSYLRLPLSEELVLLLFENKKKGANEKDLLEYRSLDEGNSFWA
ncbi:MAG: hypothetical protein CfP315_0284 [Candidatus Improbicoccus pseudotrichonymphae]|uniref:Uncharacterized protein n=1 Tax=Candidatus Improbicoccus pseudotrichonymphae TaxID=3033792 RepID=A0AA48HXX5_9FIRM|nr:MAG: hypothetical protein CfP315_0284 [Candidatus Improbicoccus pseudotrichonymphae]